MTEASERAHIGLRGLSGPMLTVRSRAAAGALLTALAAALLVSGCGSPTEAKPTAPDLSVGEILYACKSWVHDRPSTPTVIVDALPSPWLAPDARPYSLTPEQEAKITAYGARVLHRFNAQLLRIEVPTDSVPVMNDVPTGPAVIWGALSVPDTLRYDYFAEMVFDHTVSLADSVLVAQLGGAVRPLRRPFNHYNVLEAIIPDSIVPELREHGLVTLFVDFVGCGNV